jgi:hypothetical protein
MIIIWMHFFADFVLQTNKMALRKSRSWRWLGKHVLVYMIPFCYFGVRYAFVNAIAHFITDAISSRASAYYWKKENRKAFFIVIGLDQAVHMTCLMASL